jgi:lipoprotein NlpI
MVIQTVKGSQMTKLFKQIGDQVVEFTEADYAQFELDKIEAQTAADELAAKAVEKAALLVKLGITADEAKLLLS